MSLVLNNPSTPYRGNMISVKPSDVTQTDLEFAYFMRLAESRLNDAPESEKKQFRKCNGTQMEHIALRALKDVAPQTSFNADSIELVSGLHFPDIQAAGHFGVEVKSTKSDSWTSTGSSIVESTRIPDVSRIYMLFAKLGGATPEFRCRPYEQCLSNIAVTHAPRYLIDMNLADNGEENIFEKMSVDYDTFRQLGEMEKISSVRRYYMQANQAKGKYEMPWWMGDSNSDMSSSIMIRFFADLTTHEKSDIRARMFVLFPELFSPKQDKYKRAALWMCSRFSVICSNLRDTFSAGGKVEEIGGVKFKHKMPQVLNTLYQYREVIRKILKNPDEALVQDIEDNWGENESHNICLDRWLDLMQQTFNGNADLKDINLQSLFRLWGK
jgi:hypothetical protein